MTEIMMPRLGQYYHGQSELAVSMSLVATTLADTDRDANYP